MPDALSTPILFLVFNRPNVTTRVFARIRETRPERLFIAADGPRPGNQNDASRCQATRAAVSKVDWPCEVKTLFRTENLGCKRAVSESISWFFENVSAGIILEDDCLPGPDFFSFCQQLLEHHRDNPRVMHISGDNFQQSRPRGDGSYYFSALTHIWGWATWRRAWQAYDVDMRELPKFAQERVIEKIFAEKEVQDYWMSLFEKVANGEIDTWDYQWTFAVWKKQGLSALPNINLVTNIGFGPEATHTKVESKVANLPVGHLGELKHPSKTEIDREADLFSAREVFGIQPPRPKQGLWKRATTILRRKA